MHRCLISMALTVLVLSLMSLLSLLGTWPPFSAPTPAKGNKPQWGCGRPCLPLRSRSFLSHVFIWEEVLLSPLPSSEKWGTNLLLSDPTCLLRILLFFMQGTGSLSLGYISIYALVSSLHPLPVLVLGFYSNPDGCWGTVEAYSYWWYFYKIFCLCMNLLHSPKY